MSYPKWLYHKTLNAKVVQTEEEHLALGDGWEETPTVFENQAPEDSEDSGDSDDSEADEIDYSKLKQKELFAMAEAKGLLQEDEKAPTKAQLIELLEGAK